MREPFRDFLFRGSRQRDVFSRERKKKKALPESGRPERAREIEGATDLFARRFLST